MNIRRAVLALGAMILGAGFLGAFPQPAQAQTFGCVEVDDSKNFWPYENTSYYCTGTSLANGQSMASAVDGFSHGYVTEEIRSHGVKYVLWHTPADYQANSAALGFGPPASVGPRDFGVTKYDSNKRALVISLFEVNSAGEVATNLDNSLGVEIARASDYFLGYVMNGGVLKHPLDQASAYALFLTQLNHDWTQFNTKAACGGSGVFRGLADEASTMGTPPVYNYICSGPTGLGATLAPAYAGYANNKAVLQAAWPNAWVDSEDIFAHAYAQTYFTGDYQGSGTRTSEKYFTGNFQCSKFFAKLTGDTGKIPVSTSMPTGCPTITQTSVCQQRFDVDDRFPGDGFVFNCLPSGADAQQIGQALSDMANPAGNAPMPQIQEDFKNASTYIFVFADQATWLSTFNAAVAPTPAPPPLPPEALGVTYTAGDMIYIISFKSNGTLTQTVAQEKENTAHELGHAIDLIKGPSNQSNSGAFTNFVLNDLLTLDYTAVGTSQATSTPRAPCSNNNTAPFDGVKNLAGANVCTGATLNPIYAGQRNTQIAQSIDDYLFKRWNATIGWRELYATTFGDQALAPPSTAVSTHPMYVAFFNRNYLLLCTKSWGSAVVLDQTTPPAGSCGTFTHGWYTSLVSDFYNP